MITRPESDSPPYFFSRVACGKLSKGGRRHISCGASSAFPASWNFATSVSDLYDLDIAHNTRYRKKICIDRFLSSLLSRKKKEQETDITNPTQNSTSITTKAKSMTAPLTDVNHAPAPANGTGNLEKKFGA